MEQFELKTEPGKGKGATGIPRKAGGAEYCVCRNCGYKFRHTLRGEPCNNYLCPKCGADALYGV